MEQERTFMKNKEISNDKVVELIAGGVSHDLNNIIGPILGFTELLLEEIEPNTSMHEDMVLIHDSALRLREFTNDLITLSNKSTNEPSDSLLNLAAKKAIESKAFNDIQSAYSDVSFSYTEGPTGVSINFLESHLEKFFESLFSHCIEASEPDGEVTVTHTQNSLSIEYGGPTVPADEDENYFFPYYAKRELEIGRKGLLLCFAKKLAKLNNASLVHEALPDGNKLVVNFS